VISGHSTQDGAARYTARFPAAVQNQFYRPAQHRLVSTLGLGTYLGDTTPEAGAAYEAAIEQAVRGGVNFLDTAINYRNQHSERDLGAALSRLTASGAIARDEIVLCTKAGFLTPGAIPASLRSEDVVSKMHCMAPDFLEDQIDRSRANLGLETLDVFYLHNPETQLSAVTPEQFESRIRLAFTRLEKLVSESRICFYGAATWNGFRLKSGDPGRLSLKRMIDIATSIAGDSHHFRFIQLPLNLAMTEAFGLEHDEDGGEPRNVLDIAARAGITVVASASLLQARLANDIPPGLRSRLPGPVTNAQFAIQFTRSTPGITVALAGMGNPEHVAENLGLEAFPPAPLTQYLNLFRREE
jgi:aryl-alcohol dehydrogenase-like predicted oxidoreductase